VNNSPHDIDLGKASLDQRIHHENFSFPITLGQSTHQAGLDRIVGVFPRMSPSLGSNPTVRYMANVDFSSSRAFDPCSLVIRSP
jgi:hypothetical protein